jgi:hypothetical protein
VQSAATHLVGTRPGGALWCGLAAANAIAARLCSPSDSSFEREERESRMRGRESTCLRLGLTCSAVALSALWTRFIYPPAPP